MLNMLISIAKATVYLDLVISTYMLYIVEMCAYRQLRQFVKAYVWTLTVRTNMVYAITMYC